MKEIKIEMADWLYNAGIVGLVNILNHSKDEVQFNGQEIAIKPEVLDDFEEKYFNYFIDTYEKTMVYTKLAHKIENLIQIEVNESNFEKVKEDIEFIKSKMKNSAYKDRVGKINFKDLKNPTKNDLIINTQLLTELKKIIRGDKKQILKSECIGYYDQQAKISKAPNAIIDKYINTNMLDLQAIIDEYKTYIDKDKVKLNFCCFTCGRHIEKIDKGLSFINRMFFDTSRKTSNVWNYNSDIEVCPICKLVYYCVPAGFTTVYGKGVFINENNDIKNQTRINQRINICNDQAQGRHEESGRYNKH